MKQKEKHNTIGLDLGERRHRFCVLDEAGEVVEQGSLSNERVALARLTQRYRGALVVMEAGTHSPWISRYLKELGSEVIVSNPRKVRAIYQHERKSDQRDAQMLARLGRMDRALLYPVRHCSEQAQQDLLRIKLRDSLVRARVGLINSVRFSLKSLGYTVRNSSSERFHKVVWETLPEAVRQMISPSVETLAELSARITALYFVLKIEDPQRFENVRDVGAYAGLCPRRDQSGGSDPQLRISKRGDAYLRRLLVSAAQYILGPFGPKSALRAYGLMLAADGGARAKKRAVVAVARKLAVLLLSLWKNRSHYEAFPHCQTIEDKPSGTIAIHRVEA